MADQTITINVGGEKTIQVKPELFSVVGDNKFASMCSERWQNQNDADVRIFVDYSPQIFVPLIEFLRLARDSEPEMPAPVLLDPSLHRPWIRVMLAASFHPGVLRKAGMTVQKLRDCGCDTKFLCEAGFTLKELGLHPSKTAGRTSFENFDSPATQEQPQHPSLRDLVDAGYSLQELWDAGHTAAQLKAAGFTPHDFLDCGFQLQFLKEAGFTI